MSQTATPIEPGGSDWRVLVRNSNWNISAFVVAVLANFIALPFAIRNIGLDQFGAAGIFIGVFAPLMIVGTVISQASIREMSGRLAGLDHGSARSIYWTSLWLCLAGCLLVIIVMSAAGDRLLRPFLGGATLPVVLMRKLCVLAAVSWAAQQFVTTIQAALVAAQRYRELATINGLSAIVSAACVVGCTRWQPSVGGFIGGTALGYTLSAAWSLQRVRSRLPDLFPAAAAARPEVRAIFDFGRWQAVSQLAGAVAQQTDRFVLGATAALSVVGQLNVANRLQEVVNMGILKIAEVLYPHFSAAAGRPVSERVPLIMASSWVTNVIAAAALAPLVCLSKPLLELWVGPAALELGVPILKTLVTAGLVGSGTNAITYFLLGQGRSSFVARYQLIHCAIVITASVVLLLSLGPRAAGAGYLVANIVRFSLLVLAFGEISGGAATVSAKARVSITPILAGICMAWLPWPVATVNSWFSLAAAYVLLAAMAVVAAVLASLVFPESRRVVTTIRIALARQLAGS